MLKRLAAATLAALCLAACGKPASPQAPAAAPEAAPLRIIAGSELKDLEFLRPQLEQAAGRKIRFDYVGTIDMIDRLAASNGGYDLAWAASNKYLSLAAPGRVEAAEKTMLSPVVLGLKADKVKALGWDRNQPTWGDIAEAVQAGKLGFAMTNPTASNSGFSAVVGVAAALANKGDSLAVADIDTARLRQFFSGVKLTAGSSGWLADAYVDAQDRLDGMVNYESVILSLNTANRLHAPLVPVYPKEGILTADYPLMLLKGGPKPQYDQLVALLRSADIQKQIMEHTLRRPVIPEVPPLPVFGKSLLVELPFPGKLEVVDAILTAYLDDVRTPAHSYFLLDVSGSMADHHRMDDLKAALHVLAGADTGTLAGRFARFQLREKADVTTFDNLVESQAAFSFGDRAAYPKAVQDFGGFVDALRPKGGTAIYSALRQVYEQAAAARAADPGHYYTIVLMTDGENNSGIGLGDFRDWYAHLPEEQRGIRVFTILFGEGDPAALKSIAELSGGRVFDAKTATLSAVFKEIRGYQ
jgi:Ca-activated chloride channel family protein